MLTLEELVLGQEAAGAQVAAGRVTALINPRKLADLYDMAVRYTIAQMPSDHPELIAHKERVRSKILSWDRGTATAWFQDMGLLGADGTLTTTYGGTSAPINKD